jgi:hypothetical protein
MDDETPLASHIAKRGRTYRHMRLALDDIADRFFCSRIRRSLRTKKKARACFAFAANPRPQQRR